jgi:histidine ammonia-lyase
MGANAAVKTLEVVQNVQSVLAIELLNACQALHLSGTDGCASAIKNLYTAYRKMVPAIDQDQEMYPLIAKSKEFLEELNTREYFKPKKV